MLEWRDSGAMLLDTVHLWTDKGNYSWTSGTGAWWNWKPPDHPEYKAFSV
jgi:hypothetical protein